MQVKRIPLRMCAGCREMKPKSGLVRIVKSPSGELMLDLTGKKPGRGAYICKNAECLNKARKSRGVERSFQCRIPDELYDAMEKELNGGG